MKKIITMTMLFTVLPALAIAEMKMQNGNPSPEPVVEPTLGHHMQNSDPSPAQVPANTMKNTSPKKFVSTNAAAIEESHSGRYSAMDKSK